LLIHIKGTAPLPRLTNIKAIGGDLVKFEVVVAAFLALAI
jgi:hypothetical protein